MASYISALVVQKNNSVFVDDVTVSRVTSPSTGNYTIGIGVTMVVPCPDALSGGVIEGDFWAQPVNEGTVSGLRYIPYNTTEAVSSKPTPQSFAVVKISSRNSSDDWYVLGTSTQYIASCAVCCSDAPVAMPNISNIPQETGCQTLCKQNVSAQYIGDIGLPTLLSNTRYFPYGYFNKVALPAGTATGYQTTGTLLTFLNTATTSTIVNGVVTAYAGGWAVVGTWALDTNGGLIVTQTSGPGTDTLCASIVAVNPSL